MINTINIYSRSPSQVIFLQKTQVIGVTYLHVQPNNTVKYFKVMNINIYRYLVTKLLYDLIGCI